MDTLLPCWYATLINATGESTTYIERKLLAVFSESKERYLLLRRQHLAGREYSLLDVLKRCQGSVLQYFELGRCASGKAQSAFGFRACALTARVAVGGNE